ncbi:MAG: septal ring lytic transglycosylase RlpA family protein [Candidatus Acidiferrales bacterium]
MRFKLFILLEAVFLSLMTLVILPAFRPAAGRADQPATQAYQAMAATLLANPNPALTAEPLKVWEGVSSWYGEDFDGQLTANGETYDMYAATAAHPTLPLGSVVRVVNLRNHRSEVVRINDRGPYVEGRELDVSYAVARKLGFEHRGLDRVRIELLEVPARPVNPNLN